MHLLLLSLLTLAPAQTQPIACDTWAQANFNGQAFLCESAILDANKQYYAWSEEHSKTCAKLNGVLRMLPPERSPADDQCNNSGATLADATHGVYGLVMCECTAGKDWSWTIDFCGDTVKFSPAGVGSTCEEAKKRSKIKAGAQMTAPERDCTKLGGKMVWDPPPKTQTCSGTKGAYTATWSRSGTCECPKKGVSYDEGTYVSYTEGGDEEYTGAFEAEEEILLAEAQMSREWDRSYEYGLELDGTYVSPAQTEALFIIDAFTAPVDEEPKE